MKRYQRTQHTMWMWGITLVIVLVECWVARGAPLAPWLYLNGTALLLVIVTWVFTQLTIIVDGTSVRWRFGLGFVRGEISITEIASVEITQTNLAEGFGIHWTIWHGWLWNVGGFRAVQMTKRDGSRITLGTDDPEGLYDAIVAHRRGL